MAGTGVKVARRVAVGLAVSIGVTETPAMAVGVGGFRMRPQPPRTKLARRTGHTTAAMRLSLAFRHWILALFNDPLPKLAFVAAGQIVAKERGKVKRCRQGLTWVK